MSEAKSEMVERVARALFEVEWEPAKDSIDLEKEWPDSREYWLNSARAAIAAMREPTEGMIRACDWPHTNRTSSLYDVWRCMIDGALR